MYYDSEQEFDYGKEPYGSDQGDSEDDWRTDIGNFQTEYIDRERKGVHSCFSACIGNDFRSRFWLQ